MIEQHQRYPKPNPLVTALLILSLLTAAVGIGLDWYFTDPIPPEMVHEVIK